MPRQIRAVDKQNREFKFDRPDQMVGYDFKRVTIDKNDWPQEVIQQFIRPTLTKLGGELIEW